MRGRSGTCRAANYSDDLLSDARRRNFIRRFFENVDHLARDAASLDRLEKAPRLVRSVVRRMVTGRSKRDHFGQVVPIEEIEQIFGHLNSIVRIACICRRATIGKEKRYCYGISMSPDGGELARILQGIDQSYANGPDAWGLERLTREEAISAFRGHEKEGLCHTVWTFQTPFIGGICNCDRADCLAMRSTVTHDLPVMFRAEYVARVDPDLCTGCRDCMRVCQFGALSYSPSQEKAVVDQRFCYGCGVCRAACKKDAIRLEDRASVPAVAGVW